MSSPFTDAPFSDIDHGKLTGSQARADELRPALADLHRRLTGFGVVRWWVQPPQVDKTDDDGGYDITGSSALRLILNPNAFEDPALETDVTFRTWVPRAHRKDSIPLWQLEASLMVDCECARDHGQHTIDYRSVQGGSGEALEHAVTTVGDQVAAWVEAGWNSEDWRRWRGLTPRSA